MIDNPGPHPGSVYDNDDPRKLGRVRVRIPGIADAPATGWALPYGVGAGANRGLWAIPKPGDEVVVFFDQCDPEHPYYVSSNWGIGEVPVESEGSPDVRVLASDLYVVVMDDRGPGRLTILHRASGNRIEHDGGSLSMTLDATTRVTITATGQVDIRGALVTIQGRPVAGAGPI